MEPFNFQRICEYLEINTPELGRFLGLQRGTFNAALRYKTGMPLKHWQFLTALDTALWVCDRSHFQSKKLNALQQPENSAAHLYISERKEACENDLLVLQTQEAEFLSRKNKELAKLNSLYYLEENPQLFKQVHLDWIQDRIEFTKNAHAEYSDANHELLKMRMEVLEYELQLLEKKMVR